MPDPRFYSVAGHFTLDELAAISGAETSGGGSRLFSDIAPLATATSNEISFLDNRKYLDDFAKSSAGACLVRPDHAARAPGGMALLVTGEPYHGYARVAAAFYPRESNGPGLDALDGIDKSAKIGKGCRIAPSAAIGARAEIGEGCAIGPHSVIGPGVVVGDGGTIASNVTLTHCIIGACAVIHPGVRIGQDGFGFALALGPEGHLKVPQLGRVIIGEDVEIGANSTIDRGAAPDTVIGDGTKIDNLVQIGHNVRIGMNCMVVSQVGISGSTTVGDFVMLGGQAGLAGHITIGDGVRVAAKAGVIGDIGPGLTVGGYPARPRMEWLRSVATLKRLTKKKDD
jgi:UDP-3-O-[3-hydroxymyristoyl] glucosamine N-acyltransferase